MYDLYLKKYEPDIMHESKQTKNIVRFLQKIVL